MFHSPLVHIPEPDGPAANWIDAYAREVRSRRRTVMVVLLALVVLTAIAAPVAEIQPLLFFEQIDGFMSYIYRIMPSISASHPVADVAEWYWGWAKWLKLLGETLLMAYLGTLLGFIGGFFLSPLAAANLTPAKWMRIATRRFLDFCRTVPDMVFALLFVIAFGIGPMAGVLAVAIHCVGALGKQFSEVVENIDMKPVEGITSAGGSWRQVVRYAVLPQVMPNFASYTMLRFDINVRLASIMGFVGAGGIGEELMIAIRRFYYTDVSAILLLILITVMLIDFASEKMRHALAGREKKGKALKEKQA